MMTAPSEVWRGWELISGDAVIGELHFSDLDQPWFNCRFLPCPGFETVSSLFAAELRIMKESCKSQNERFDEWDAAYAKIVNLKLKLRPHPFVDDGVIDEFLLHIDGEVAWFRY